MQQEARSVSGTPTPIGDRVALSTRPVPGAAAPVLLAVGSDEVRSVRVEQLRAAGLGEVVVARTGFEAIVKATCLTPAVILLDPSLGRGAIAETRALLASCPVTAPIPIISLTTRATLSRRVLAAIAA
jgi:CheY-like chemotaxis protein